MERPHIPGWELAGQLGRGGFATVWEGRRGDDRAAVKVSRLATAAARRRFAREADAMRRVRPPAAPALFDAGEHVGLPYLAMERIGGQTLATLLAGRDAPPPPLWIRAVAAGILAHLAAVHRAGLVHADLKPANLRVDPDGATVRLLDFGLAVSPGAEGVVGGTPRYAAPEQIRRERVTPATDVYGLGLILYEMLAGRPPFAADLDYGHLILRPPPLTGAPAGLAKLALACLAKQGDARPSVDELAAALAGDVAGRDSSAAAEETAPAPARSPRRPIVLAFIDVRAPAILLQRRVAMAGGFVVRQSGPRWLVAFDGLTVSSPADAALDLARQAIDELGGRAALHLCNCDVRERAHGPPALTAPPERTWVPDEFSGLHLSDEFDRVRAEPDVVTALVGREEPLAAAERSARLCLERRSPGLLLVIGDSGLGKTRLLDEIGRRVHGPFDVRIGEPPPRVLRPTAVLIDDIDRAPDALLGAVEYATLDARDRPLWVVAAAHPRLARRRPAFGERADRRDRIDLEPLAGGPARDLCAELLRPAERIPEPALDRLVGWAGANPGRLVEICRALHRGGLVRRRTDLARWFLAVDELDRVAVGAPSVWIAARRLENLPPELAELVRAAAHLGDGFAAAELAAVLGHARVDPDVGLYQIGALGWIERDGDGYRFRSPPLRDGVRSLTDAQEAGRFHERALRYWRGRAAAADWRGRAALARHAAAVGEAAEAAAVHLELAEDARRAHRLLDADRHYGAALALGDGSIDPVAAHMGRGSVRYRIDRAREALLDLETAERLARERGDGRRAAAALLDQSTALDWMSRYPESEGRALAAAALVDGLGDPVLAARVAAARGRSALRLGRVDHAVSWLTAGAESGAAAPDYDARVVSLLLLGPALVQVGRIDEAAARFDEVVRLCEEAGDILHLCAALGNRVALWSARREPALAAADLERARELARRLGHVVPERNTTLNLAEYEYWSGRDRQALALAVRARSLQERCVGPPLEDALLCARIQLSLGDTAAAAADLAVARAAVPETAWSNRLRALARMVELALAGGDWDALERDAVECLSGDEEMELLYWRARTGDTIATERARARLAAFPLWHGRFSQRE